MASQMLLASVDTFLKVLEKSSLLTDEVLGKTREAAGDSADPVSLARDLVKQGALTKWQAGQLLHGFFLLIVGKYKLLDQLGSGEMGRVYLAEHVQMGRRHALKVLSKRHTQERDQVKKFLAEAQRVCDLDHRNLSHIYDVNQDGDKFYVVMEYVEGHDLQKLVEKSGRLPVSKAVDYVRQAAEGLAHAHEQNVVHGDLKPSNLIVDTHTTIKIMDIGQSSLAASPAKSLDESAENGSLAATMFHAPEQRGAERKIDQRSDVYSLGAICSFLLTGKAAVSAAEAKEHLAAVKEVPAEAAALVEKMMADKPDERPQTMIAVLEELAKVPQGKAAAPPVPKAKDSKVAAPGAKANGAADKPALPKAKKPPVAKSLDEPQAEGRAEISVAPAEEAPADDNPFGGFSLNTKGKKGSAKATPAPEAKPAAESNGKAKKEPEAKAAKGQKDAPAPAPAKKKGKNANYTPLVIAGVIGGSALAVIAMISVVLLLVFGGGSDKPKNTELAAATEPGAEATTTPTPEGNPPPAEANPAEGNPAEANPLAATPSTPETPMPMATPAPMPTPSPMPTPAPMPATPDPAKPPETPAVTPTPMPMPMGSGTETLTPPTPPTKNKTKPKVEPEPKPATPPKAAPAVNPFQGFAKSVTLPKLGPATSEQPSEVMAPAILGPAKVGDKLVFVNLKGGDGAVKSGRQKFELKAARGGTAERDWEVTLVGGEAPVIVALMSVKDDNFTFQWTPDGAKQQSAPFLCNCALDIRSGAGQQEVALRQAVAGEPLVADYQKTGAGVKWTIENMPDPKKVFVQVGRLEGNFIKTKIEGPELESNADSGTVWTGNTDDALILGLKFTTKLSTRTLDVTTAPVFKIGDMPKPAPLTKKDMTTIKPTLDRQRAGLQGQLTPLLNQRTPAAEAEKLRINAEIQKVTIAEGQLDQLNNMVTGLSGSGKIHFRIFYRADEGEIDLVQTDPNAGAAAPDKK